MPLCIYLCHKHLQRTYELIRDGWKRADICRGNYTGWPLGNESVRYWPSTVNYTLKFVTPYKAILVCWWCNVRWSSERAEKVVGRAQWNGTYSLGYYPNAIIGHTFTPAERGLLALPVRMGGLRITNPCHIAASEYEASIAITERPVEQIVAHTQELPDDRAIVHCSNVSVERSICALQTT